MALGAVAALALAAAGCGGQAATIQGVDHYTNAGFHFSLDVDRRLTEWRSATAATSKKSAGENDGGDFFRRNGHVFLATNFHK